MAFGLQRQKLPLKVGTGSNRFPQGEFAFGKPADAVKLPVVVPEGFRYFAPLIQRQCITAGTGLD